MNPPLAVAPPALPLADRFRLQRAHTISLDGERVRADFALPVPAGASLRVHRRHATTDRPQGLRMASTGDLIVNGHRTRDFTLWSTTSPELVTVEAPGEELVVRMWNMWRADGVDHAWLANAGMMIEIDLTGPDPAVILWCSDGEGDVTFDDLVVAVEILLPAEGTTGHIASITSAFPA